MKVKKIISVLCAAVLAVSAAVIPCSAESTDGDGTNTYYFMAPEDWFNTDKGAVNEEIGCYWWRPEEKASWPGNKMTSAPEIGRNVFKITDVPDGAFEIIFNDYTENTDGREAFRTIHINTEGYAKGECPYSSLVETDSFDGWIYVLDFNAEPDFDHPDAKSGAWFQVQSYFNYKEYYGTYPELKNDTVTYYFLAPSDWCSDEEVRCYWWMPEEKAAWPGNKMIKAPDIGENVYKIADVPKGAYALIFNDVSDVTDYATDASTTMVNTEGYREGECPYSDKLETDSFDGWIYVLEHDAEEDFDHPGERSGAWFRLDEYKSNSEYYGSYPEFKPSSVLGDLDGDGKITSGDALIVLRISVELDDKMDIADIDSDGFVTSSDALAVLHQSVGEAAA